MKTKAWTVVNSSQVVIKGGVARIVLPLNPVPASRPRVTRWGTYYGKKYAEWMKAAAESLGEIDEVFPKGQHLKVEVYIAVEKPRTSKLTTPRGDIDNYLKAILDALTKSGIWNDDDQITVLEAEKEFKADGLYSVVITAI